MTSFSSCGVCIVLLSKLVLRADVMAGSRVVLRRVADCLPVMVSSFRLSHPAGSVGDPKLD